MTARKFAYERTRTRCKGQMRTHGSADKCKKKKRGSEFENEDCEGMMEGMEGRTEGTNEDGK